MARKPVERSSRGGSRRSKSNTVSINFKGVETFTKMEDGENLLKVVETSLEKGAAGDYIKWVLENEDDARVYHNTSLSEKSLWNTKAWLEALGVDVPDDEMELNLEEMVDLEIMGDIELELFEGKKRPRIVDFWPVEEKKPSREEKNESRRGGSKEEPERGSRRGGKNNTKKEFEAPTDAEVDDMSEDELADVIKEGDLDVDLDKFRTLSKKQNAVKEALGD